MSNPPGNSKGSRNRLTPCRSAAFWLKCALALVLLASSAAAQQQPAGTVSAWGYNYYGELGNGGKITSAPFDVTTPGQVANLTNIVSVAGGAYHTLALKSDGTVWAWGANSDGELGDGTTADRLTPVQVIDPNDPSGFLTGVVQIASGFFFNLAVKSDGTIRTWGVNTYGQLGNGTFLDSSVPIEVVNADGSPFSGAIGVAGGGNHSLALKNDGTVWAWGANNYGQLGDGNGDESVYDVTSTPLEVVDPLDSTAYLTGVAVIASGADHSLALKGDGTVWAWGDNQYGQIGNGSTTSLDGSGAAGIAYAARVSDLSDIVTISGGGDHSLALKKDGTVWAWGHNIFGELGDGGDTPDPPYGVDLPLEVLGASGLGSNLTNVVGIAAGGDFSLALLSDGTVWAWGDNEYGELGNGTTSTQPPYGTYWPGNVHNLGNAWKVAGGAYHSLAIVLPSGGAQTSVPSVIGDSEASAAAAISSAGLSLGTITQQVSDTQAPGNVIGQSPTSGTMVASGSYVNLTVSSETALTVPNVVGEMQSAAVSAITGAGLTPGSVTQQSSSTIPAGYVISENPSAGTPVNAGSTVNLGVSSGPAFVADATAVFVGRDTHTQGTWQNSNGKIYGTDGYIVEGDTGESLPSYIAQFSTQNATAYTWVSSTTDPRALLKADNSGRIAGCLFGGSFTLDIDFTQGSHLFAIYALDWDSTARSETITIMDPNNGNEVLDSEVVSNFHGGAYLVWNVSGQVTVQVTRDNGANAVLSGIFFGVADTVNVTPSSATLSAGQEQQFAAAFTGTSGVTWSLVPSAPSSGAISSSGEYTAPAAISEQSTVMVQATTSDGTASGQATVTLVPPSQPVSVPSVIGDTQSVATTAINNAGLMVGTVTSQSSSTVPSGDVISQNPAASTQVNSGTAVNLVLSSGAGSSGSGPSVSLISADTTTQGNWQGVYGADGSYIINGLPASIPAYATFNVASGTPYTWAANTSDARALQTGDGPGGSRTAATWYSATSVVFNLNINGTHGFSLYSMDWDHDGRAETVTIMDPNNNNAVLDTEQLLNSNLANGEYLSWNISGQVKIVISLNAGSGGNAVVSGVFFGGSTGSETVTVKPQQVTLAANQQQTFTAVVSGVSNQGVTWSVTSGPGSIDPSSGVYTAPASVTSGTVATIQATSADGMATGTATVTLSTTAAASFIGLDTTTQGNWQGVYGSAGEMIVNGPQSAPSANYGSFNSVQNATQYTWASSTSDVRALETGSGVSGTRTATTWFGSSFTFDVTLNGPQKFELYALDWDSGGRVEKITIADATTNSVLDTRTVSSFSQGVYIAWNIAGHVKITVTLNSGANAVIGGAFFN